MAASPDPPPVRPPPRQEAWPRQESPPPRDDHDRHNDLLEIQRSIDRRLRNINSNITAIGIVFLIWMGLKLLAFLYAFSVYLQLQS